MKKITTLVAACLVAAGLSACGGGSGGDDGASQATASSAASSSQASSISSSAASSRSSSAASSAATAAITVHLLGDSTMTTYTEDRRPQMGWGEALPKFVNGQVTIRNWAAGGRSSRSFYYETGMWDAAKAAIGSGDYVIIQFGHNDQKYGSDTSTGPYSTYGTYAICSDPAITDGEKCTGGADTVETGVDRSEHSYYQFLKRYVTEVRAKGGIPILMTPMVRLDMSGGAVTVVGQHDYSGTVKGGEANPRGNYPAAMKAVASKYAVPLVDITTETAGIVNSFGKQAAAAALYVSGDSTHPQIMFASLIAKKATEGIKGIPALSGLSAALSTTATTLASPASLAFGGQTVGSSAILPFALAAFGQSPAAGSLSLSAPAGFELSTDQSTWSQTLALAYSGGELTKVVYARFVPGSAMVYGGNITATLSGNAVASVAVSGTGVAGITDYAQWFTNGADLGAVLSGNRLAASAASVVGLSEASAASTVTWTVDGATVSPQRYVVDTWIQRDETKYIQVAVTPKVAMSVARISMYFASYGGSNLRADIAYSLSADFSGALTLNGSTPLSSTKDTLTLANYALSTPIAVPAGGTLYVRIFPWQKSSTSNSKGIALYKVLIGG